MIALIVALVLSCGPDSKGEPACAHASVQDLNGTSTAAGTPEALVVRGDKLKGLPAVSLAAVLESPAKYDGKTVSVEAKVRKACSKMGCWMELAATDKSPGVRVTMKDHGFFVPLDSAGRTAKVEGVVKVASLSPASAEHFKAEGAQVAQGKDGAFREVQLVADGVELRK